MKDSDHKIEIWREFTFEAAHHLPKFPDGHKCKRLHGHSYSVRIYVVGEIDETGIIIDFATISDVWKEYCHSVLDHRCLNEVRGLENPTAEYLSRWIFDQMAAGIHSDSVKVTRVELGETCTAGATCTL